MKRSLCAIAAFGFAIAARGADLPDPATVDHYLSSAGLEAAFAGQIDAYKEQFSEKVPEGAKARMSEYLDRTMGWNNIKDSYAKLVMKTYTADEVRAAIAYLDSPMGKAWTSKNRAFFHDYGVLSAKNAMNNVEPNSHAPTAKYDDAGAATAGELLASNVEEHAMDGQTFFTGMLENKGKAKARAVQVEVNLFLGAKFVDQYSTYVAGNIPPGATRYFKVNCGCKGERPAQHDTFKVNVVDTAFGD